ncbi:Uma2 family endonuclease [Anaerolineales bacterium HSG6]|nr:Uma2 family endonuclease [Anaerolineales bacterium HSG6]
MLETVATLERTETQQTAQPKIWQYEDYLKLPDDGKRYEIIEGVLYVANAPNINHQFAVFEISRQIGNHVLPNKLGYVLTAPFEVHLSQTSRPVQPDVLFIGVEHWPSSNIQYFEGAPSLVVEVLSPSSLRLDRVIKFNAYEKAGVAEYWIVNPKTRSIEVYTLSGGEYALLDEFTADEVIRSNVLPELSIAVSALFMME